MENQALLEVMQMTGMNRQEDTEIQEVIGEVVVVKVAVAVAVVRQKNIWAEVAVSPDVLKTIMIAQGKAEEAKILHVWVVQDLQAGVADEAGTGSQSSYEMIDVIYTVEYCSKEKPGNMPGFSF